MPIVLETYNADGVRIYGGYIIHQPVDRITMLKEHHGINFNDVDMFTGDLSPIDYIGDIDGFQFTWAQTKKFGILTVYGRSKSRVRAEASRLTDDFGLIELDVPIEQFKAGIEACFPRPKTNL